MSLVSSCYSTVEHTSFLNPYARRDRVIQVIKDGTLVFGSVIKKTISPIHMLCDTVSLSSWHTIQLYLSMFDRLAVSKANWCLSRCLCV